MNTESSDNLPHTLGWHDSHCASAALLSRDGRILHAVAEERFTKRKLQKGYPVHAMEDIATRFSDPRVATGYTDMHLPDKIARNAGLVWNSMRHGLNCSKTTVGLARTLLGRLGRGRFGGMSKSRRVDSRDEGGYDSLCEHHAAHALSAYFLSGFNNAYVVTIDGVGDCLSGTVWQATGGQLALQRKFYYNELTVGADYETFTAMMGFDPDRHCGKITGLAAMGRHNADCIAALDEFFRMSWRSGQRNYFDRIHGTEAVTSLAELRSLRGDRFGHFTREDLAYAIQHLAERRVLQVVRENVPDIPRTNIALAGGVFANVRINQKVKELGFRSIFIVPAMDDCGLSLGAAFSQLACTTNLRPHRVPNMFVGPGYGESQIQAVLDETGVWYERVDNAAYAIARLLADGKVVARFDGRMEFGPRALGNRSILHGTSDPTVNDWLNKKLRRSEFMPFAPATLAERAEECYQGLEGCEHTAEFMTITFDCTDYMKRVSPAVVHVDGTARAQLVTCESNPGMHEIIDEYHKITGIPSLVNTSFNMHESPIVATPVDAVRAFRQGRLDYLAIGPFLVKADCEEARTTQERDHRVTAGAKALATADGN